MSGGANTLNHHRGLTSHCDCCNSCQELDLEGANEEAARQLCALMTTLADLHWAHVDSVQKQHQILRHVSGPLIDGFVEVDILPSTTLERS